jgi:uncharacterized protein YutE (UPF0331/DUF86 family)
MTFLVERLTELRRHLDHLRGLSPRIEGVASLERDMSLRNDVLFSLLMVAQLVIDIAGELSARRGLRFDDYTGAVRNLRQHEGFTEDVVAKLARLPGFRNVVIHEYVALDLERVLEALHDLEPVEQLVGLAAAIEGSES